MRIAILAGMSVLLLHGCTTVPEQIQGDYAALTPARVESAQFGTPVRWGGVILNTRHDQNQTCFEVLSRSLDKHLRPELEDDTAGRYIACADGFYDPVVFSRGREVTLTGTVTEFRYRPLEKFNYRYPVVDIDELVLWQKRRKVLVYNHHGGPWYGGYWGRPYWGYYGWYDPWWPRRSHAYEMTLLPDPAEVENLPTPLRLPEEPE